MAWILCDKKERSILIYICSIQLAKTNKAEFRNVLQIGFFLTVHVVCRLYVT